MNWTVREKLPINTKQRENSKEKRKKGGSHGVLFLEDLINLLPDLAESESVHQVQLVFCRPDIRSVFLGSPRVLWYINLIFWPGQRHPATSPLIDSLEDISHFVQNSIRPMSHQKIFRNFNRCNKILFLLQKLCYWSMSSMSPMCYHKQRSPEMPQSLWHLDETCQLDPYYITMTKQVGCCFRYCIMWIRILMLAWIFVAIQVHQS